MRHLEHPRDLFYGGEREQFDTWFSRLVLESFKKEARTAIENYEKVKEYGDNPPEWQASEVALLPDQIFDKYCAKESLLPSENPSCVYRPTKAIFAEYINRLLIKDLIKISHVCSNQIWQNGCVLIEGDENGTITVAINLTQKGLDEKF